MWREGSAAVFALQERLVLQRKVPGGVLEGPSPGVRNENGRALD